MELVGLKKILVVMLLSWLTLEAALAETFDHSPWDALLKAHVISIGQATAVDYQGLSDSRDQLKNYLQALASVNQADFDSWPKNGQLALLINAYNAWTVELILTAWPRLDSIKDLGSFFRSPWSKAFIPLLGETRSLDDIEHNLIRGSGRYNDPRIHFAVNCASIGCPSLRPEAYIGDRLDEQLHQQTRLFLSDRGRNRLEGDALKLSPIFKWYRGDFEKGWKGYHRLTEFLIDHTTALSLPPKTIERMRADEIDIDYLDYDWRLNVAR